MTGPPAPAAPGALPCAVALEELLPCPIPKSGGNDTSRSDGGGVGDAGGIGDGTVGGSDHLPDCVFVEVEGGGEEEEEDEDDEDDEPPEPGAAVMLANVDVLELAR